MSEEQKDLIIQSLTALSEKVDENTQHFTKRFDSLESEVKDVKTAITGNKAMGQVGLAKRQENFEQKMCDCEDKTDKLEKKMLIAGVLLLGISLGPEGLKLLSKLF